MPYQLRAGYRSPYSDWLRAGRIGERIPVGARFSAPVQSGPGDYPASCTMGNESFPGVKNGRDVKLTPHPLLVLRSWKGITIPLLPLWAIRPVQSLSACTRGALYLTSVPVQGCTLPYVSACTRVHFTLRQCLYRGALYLVSEPVQGCTLPYLRACTRVHFTLPQSLYKDALYLTSVPVQGCTLPYLSACTRVHFTFTFTFLGNFRQPFHRTKNSKEYRFEGASYY